MRSELRIGLLLAMAACAAPAAKERLLLDGAEASLEASDLAGARAKATQAIDALLARQEHQPDEVWIDLLSEAGMSAWNAQDPQAAKRAWSVVLDVRSRTLPDEHPALQHARRDLGNALYVLGDVEGSLPLRQKVLDVYARTLPADHRDLQRARGYLASTLHSLDDLEGARALQEQVLEVYARTLPEDDLELQQARANLGGTLFKLGHVDRARELEEQAIEVFSRTLPDEHPYLQTVRRNLAVTLSASGDLDRVAALQEQVLEVCARTLPEDHREVRIARSDLASTLFALGELDRARALRAEVVAVCERTLPADHVALQLARGNLANTLTALGDPAGARILEEQVLEVFSRTLPDDDVRLQQARLNFAITLHNVGDYRAARALFESVLEAWSSTLPDDDVLLQIARTCLAATLGSLGDYAGARAIQEKVLEVCELTLPPEHTELLTAKANLATTIKLMNDLEPARALEEDVLAVLSNTLPETHLEVQRARLNLALTLRMLGDLAGARALEESALAVCSRTLPDEHPDLQRVRGGLACTLAAEGEIPDGRKRCVEIVAARCASETRAARTSVLTSSPREAEARCRALCEGLDIALSVAGGMGGFPASPELERPSFRLSEATRGAALSCASTMRLAAGSPRYAELRRELAVSSEALASLASAGTTTEAFQRALARRESVERELVEFGGRLSAGDPSGIEIDVDGLAGSLGERDAIVAYRRFERWSVDAPTEPTLSAFVLRREGLAWTPLGPLAPVEDVVSRWRAAVGVASDARGVGPAPVSSASSEDESIAELRERILDPLKSSLKGADRLVIVLDDVLHLVPFELLVDDALRVEMRATVTELLARAPSPAGPDDLLAVGGVEFEDVATPSELPSILRGGSFGGFAPLPATAAEVEALAESFARRSDAPGEARLLVGARATREHLTELVPASRWLHVATHGWFANEAIRSWSDPEPIDRRSGLGMRMTGAEQVEGMSPKLLCGLAIAGANRDRSGLVTADEIAAFDLGNCELAVLSACDTNVGLSRAGQGVASLQMALQMAGARSVITSLWKVPDEATRELMSDFYRRLWEEGKPKWLALREAKRRLRDAKDETGKPRYATRDWAAWILTGDPD